MLRYFPAGGNGTWIARIHAPLLIYNLQISLARFLLFPDGRFFITADQLLNQSLSKKANERTKLGDRGVNLNVLQVVRIKLIRNVEDQS